MAEFKKVIIEHETRTVYFNENHLKPMVREKLEAGLINPYNIGLYSLSVGSKYHLDKRKDLGFKGVFLYNGCNVLLTFNK